MIKKGRVFWHHGGLLDVVLRRVMSDASGKTFLFMELRLITLLLLCIGNGGRLATLVAFFGMKWRWHLCNYVSKCCHACTLRCLEINKVINVNCTELMNNFQVAVLHKEHIIVSTTEPTEFVKVSLLPTHPLVMECPTVWLSMDFLGAVSLLSSQRL